MEKALKEIREITKVVENSVINSFEMDATERVILLTYYMGRIAGVVGKVLTEDVEVPQISRFLGGIVELSQKQEEF